MKSFVDLTGPLRAPIQHLAALSVRMVAALACLLLVDSRAWAQAATWGMGWDGMGQLGRGGAVGALEPRRIVGEVTTVAAGRAHTLWILKDGTLWAAGANDSGQLGDGTLLDRPTPVQIASGVAAVAAGASHSVFLKTDGTVWAMGANSNYQLGDGTTTSRLQPVRIASGAKAVSAGSDASYYLGVDGVVRGMGGWVRSQFNQTLPEPLASGVTALAAGSGSLLMLQADGTVLGIGSNSSGQLGASAATSFASPQVIATGAVSIAAGGNHSFLVKMDGSLWATGLNGSGQLGDGTTATRRGFSQVATNVRLAACGSSHSLLVKTDGSVWSMGAGAGGRLGDGTGLDRTAPVQVATSAKAVFAGDRVSLILKDDGSLWGTGGDGYGQLGIGAARQVTPPALVGAGAGTKAIAAGENHTLLIAADNALLATGANDYGQLGDGTTADRISPVRIAEGVVAAAAGARHSLFIKTDGSLWGMGAAGNNELGPVYRGKQTAPVRIADGVKAVAAGESYSAFIKTDGTLWAMGSGLFCQVEGLGGELVGNGVVKLADGVSSHAAGRRHLLFVLETGSLMGVGFNSGAAMGAGSGFPYPREIASSVKAAAGGRTFSLFLKRDGVLMLVGSNERGTLGSGRLSGNYDGTILETLATGVASIAAGANHAAFIDTQGMLWSVGDNGAGQLGDGMRVSHRWPVLVAAGVSQVSAGGQHTVFTAGADIRVTRPAPKIDAIAPTSVVAGEEVVLAGSGFSGAQSVRFNGVEVAGYTIDSDTRLRAIPASSAAGTGPVTVASAGGTASSAASLTVRFAIAGQPLAQRIAPGEPLTLSVSAVGVGPLNYQWRLSGIPLSGATQATYSVAQARKSDAGNYDVIVGDGQSVLTSAPAQVVVVEPPSFFSVEQPRIVVQAGGSCRLSVSCSSELPVRFRWWKSGTALPAQVGRTLEFLNATAADAGNYLVEVSNAAGAVMAPPMELVVVAGTPPRIATQPSGGTAVVGDPVSFSVAVVPGYAVTYQWRKDGVPIEGATAQTYSIPAVAATDTGAYTVVVTNSNGATVSAAATLLVQPMVVPVIQNQPASLEVDYGAEASLTVVAGAGAAFQWSRDGVPVPGATRATLRFPAARAADAGVYTVAVSNAAGAVGSQPATLSVKPVVPPSIVSQPASQTSGIGDSVVFYVEAGGSEPKRFQWKRNGAALAGATAASLWLKSLRLDQAGSYTVEVVNDGGSVESAPAQLTVQATGMTPRIFRQPQDAVVVRGGTAVFSVDASVDGSTTFVWKKNGAPVAAGGRATGITTDKLYIVQSDTSDAGAYTVEVSNPYGSVVSAPASLTLSAPVAPVITAQPADAFVAPGFSGTVLRVAATGSEPLAYQWLRDGASVDGATLGELSYYPVAALHSGSYAVRVSNAGGSVTSAAARITVLPVPPPVIQSQSIGGLVYVGEQLRLSVSMRGAGPFAYQWEKDGQVLSGGASSSYPVDTSGMTASGTYQVRVSNEAGSVVSAPIVVIMRPAVAPTIVRQPVAASEVAQGDSFPQSLSVVAAGSPSLVYQWFLDGVPIAGATNASYQRSFLNAGDYGSYAVRVSNGGGSVMSTPTLVTRAPGTAPTVSIYASSPRLSFGQGFYLSSTVTGTGPLAYQWRKDGNAVSSVQPSSYSVDAAKATDAGTYQLTVSNALGSATSNSITLTVDPGVAPTLVIQPSPQSAPTGGSAAFTVVAIGSPTLTYRWIKNGVTVAQTTSGSYVVWPVGAESAGLYSVLVSNDLGSVQSTTAALVVEPGVAPTILVHPATQEVPYGARALLSVNAAGSQTLRYTWWKDGQLIPGRIEQSLSIDSVRGPDAGAYTVQVSNSYGKVTSSAAVLTVGVAQPPQILSQPESVTVPAGGGMTLFVKAVGSNPLRYTWKRNGTVLPEQTNSTLSFYATQSGHSGSYSVTVSNDAGSVESASAVVTIAALVPPSILAQPENMTAQEGSPARFSVGVQGSEPLRYQWLYAGAALPSETYSSLSIEKIRLAQAGEYQVLVTNGVGQVLSAKAVLTVQPPAVPVVTSQPSSVTVALGTRVSFSASCSTPASAQWLKNGVALPGATNQSLSINPAQAEDAGVYSVRFTNVTGSVTSAGATLTVSPLLPPMITAQSAATTVQSGQTATLAVKVSGSSPMTYVWTKDGTVLAQYDSTLYLSLAKPADSGTYRVKVSNAAGSVESQPMQLTVAAPVAPSIIANPVPVTVPYRGGATLSVGVAGSAPMSITWMRNGMTISGPNSNTLYLNSVTESDSGSYSVVVSNAAGSVTSAGATVTVLPAVAPKILEQPATQAVAAGGTLQLRVRASGTAPLSYVWRFNGQVLNGFPYDTYAQSGATPAMSGSYTVDVYNDVGSVTSQAAQVIVAPLVAPTIQMPPQPLRIYEGGVLSLGVAASGTPPLRYQWRKGSWNMPSAMEASFNISPASVSDAGSYSVVVSNGAGSVVSVPVVVEVVPAPPPIITQQPENLIVPNKGSFKLTVTAKGVGSLSYQWYFGGVSLAGATSSTYSKSGVLPGDSGSFTVKVSNAGGSVLSSPAIVQVLPADKPTIRLQPSSAQLQYGQSLALTVGAEGTPTLNYQWYKDGESLGVWAQSYHLGRGLVSKEDAGSYQVKVWNEAGSVMSNAAVVTVSDAIAPVITNQPLSGRLAVGYSLSLTVTATGSPMLSYQWFKDGGLLAGADSSWLQVTAPGTYRVTVSNVAGTVTSEPAVVTQDPPVAPVISSQPVSQSVAFGGYVSLQVYASGTAPLAFQWKKDNAAIPGATASGYWIESARKADAGVYVVEVSNAAGKVVSAAAVVTVGDPLAPTIVREPEDLNRLPGDSAMFSVSATGSNALFYQWSLNGQPIPNATSESYYVESVFSDSVGEYTVKVSNAYGQVVSRAAKLELNVAVAPAITRQPMDAMVNEGGALNLSVGVSGSAPLRYTWRRNGQLLSQNTGTLSVYSCTDADAGVYTVAVSNAAGEVVSQSVLVTVLPFSAPIIVKQPMGLSVATGADVRFIVQATGGGALTYRWLKDGMDVGLVGSEAGSLFLSEVTTFEAGVYSVVVSNAKGTVTSEGARLIVAPPVAPTITSAPQALVVDAGKSASLRVQASGSRPMRFVWQKDGHELAAGKTSTDSYYLSSSANLNPALEADSGSYTVTLSNSAGTVTSTPVAVLVRPVVGVAPAITSQPQSYTVDYGSYASFNVTASGTDPLSFQWKKDGVPLTGQQSSNCYLSVVTQGATYTVEVRNDYGSVISSPAILTVRPPVAPSFYNHPSGGSVPYRDQLYLSAYAAGSTPIALQWYKNGTKLSGATASTYIKQNAEEGDSGSYVLEATNIAGKATSNAATITVLPPVSPTITSQPTSIAVALRGNASFSVGAQGTGPMSYQWQRNGQDLPGGTGSRITIPAANAADAGTYSVLVRNDFGSVQSAAAALVVSPGVPPSVTRQPEALQLAYGQSLALNIDVSGTEPLRCQWYKDGVMRVGATDRYLTYYSATTSDSGYYSVRVSNDFGSVTSAAARVTVGLPQPPVITRQPVGGAAALESRFSLSVQAQGSGTLSYQWMKNGVILAESTYGYDYYINSFKPSDAGSYSVRIYNNFGVVTSQAVSVTMNAAGFPAIVVQPQPRSVGYGGSASFSVQASGSATLRYQWKRNGLSVPGADAPTLTLASAKTTDAGDYTVVVWNDIGSTNSQPAALSVAAATPLRITRQPEAQLVAQGQSASLVVAAEGTGTLTYQWRKDGAAIAGATAATYAIAAAQPAHAGSYSVLVADELTSVVSASAKVAVVPAGVNAVQALVGEGYRAGSSVTITNTVSHPGGATDVVLDALIPSGWSYASGTSEGATKPTVGTVETLHWSWAVAPASPFTFTYTLQVPTGQSGDKTIASMATMTLPGQSPFGFLVKPDPLIVRDTAYHGADTNRNWRIDTAELLRVVDLFNARQGAVRTGCYRVLDSTVDGFDPDSTRGATDAATLTRLHAADTNRDGRIDLAELTRLIQLHNARQGAARTGDYHPRLDAEPASGDGFTPGPRP